LFRETYFKRINEKIVQVSILNVGRRISWTSECKDRTKVQCSDVVREDIMALCMMCPDYVPQCSAQTILCLIKARLFKMYWLEN